MLSELQPGFGNFLHTRFHPRVWKHEGCVIDLGCSEWDWSSCFLGKKRVIGCDPCETTVPVGAELFKGFIGNFCGRISYQNGDPNRVSGLVSGECEAEMITLKELAWRFHLPPISLLKMNIEGMEYDLLIHLQEPIAEQIVVSFHDQPRLRISNGSATEAVLHYLSTWYDWCQIDAEWGWYVLVKR